MAELATLSTDTLKKGILDTIVYYSPWFQTLPVIDITGNNYLYNWETALAGATFYTPNDQWGEVGPTWAQRSVALHVLGGDADVDKFMQQTRSNSQDLKAAIIEKKSKAIAYAFDEFAVMGGTSTLPRYTNGKAFTGILKQIAWCDTTNGTAATTLDSTTNTQVTAATSGAGVALTLDFVDQLLDTVKPKATHIVMNRRMRRKVQSLARAAGNNLQITGANFPGALGQFVTMYGEQQILIDDWSPDHFQDGSASALNIAAYDGTAYDSTHDNSIIIALRLEDDGVCGLRNGSVQVEELGTVQDHDATRTRIKFYCGLAVFNKLSVGALINVNYSG
jgi:hypothetical protein